MAKHHSYHVNDRRDLMIPWIGVIATAVPTSKSTPVAHDVTGEQR